MTEITFQEIVAKKQNILKGKRKRRRVSAKYIIIIVKQSSSSIMRSKFAKFVSKTGTVCIFSSVAQ